MCVCVCALRFLCAFWKVPWGGVALLPLINEEKLVKAMEDVVAKSSRGLSHEEKARNRHGTAFRFRYNTACSVAATSTVPATFPSCIDIKVEQHEFEHTSLPPGVPHFPHWVLSGCPRWARGFPTLNSLDVDVR